MKKKKSISSVDELLAFFAKDPKNVEVYKKKPFDIQITAKFSAEEKQSDNTRQGLVPIVAAAYHDGVNFNETNIEPEKFVEHTKTIPYRPILAYIEENGDEPDFTGHEIETVIDEETGETKFKYLEKPIGVISEDYEIVYDEEDKVNRAIIKGFLFEQYADDAIEIIRRRRDVDCSVELAISSFSYDVDTQILTIDDYFVRGLTLLGAEHQPGMKGSHAILYEDSQQVIENFYNSLTDVQKEQIKELGTALFNLSEKAKEKKGDDSMKATFNCCIKQGDTELTFDRSLQDEQADVLISFAKSLDESSNFCLWDTAVYEGYIIARNTEDNKFYRFDYSKTEDGAISFSEGLAVEAFWMTKEEADSKNAAYDQMKSDLEQVQFDLKKYQEAEIKAQKEAVLSDVTYMAYSADPEFVELKNNMDGIGLEELKVKAELAFAKCVRRKPIQKADPELQPKPNAGQTFTFTTPNSDPSRLRYGNLFKEDEYIK